MSEFLWPFIFYFFIFWCTSYDRLWIY